MHFLKENKTFLKYFTLTFVGSSAGWVYYQVNRTRYILNNALDTSVLHSIDKNVTEDENSEDETVELEPFIEYRKRGFIDTILDALKFSYARRLLAVSKSGDRFYRAKAVDQLAMMRSLDDWHFALIANMIDPRTAVSLARMRDTDDRFFLDPPFRYHNYDKDMLINAMRDFLIHLYDKSQHPCLGYFLSKVFVYEHDSGHIVDHDSSSLELSKFIQSEKEKLPLCLESLLHHVSVERYSTDIADLDGLPLLMEIHKRYADNLSVTAKLCQIISYMSYNKHLLEPIYKSGWIGLLKQWSTHDDIRICVPAARALANLDDDYDSRYSKCLYLLHPVNKTKRSPDVDVIFVHGLLGGVFFTWRQRLKNKNDSVDIVFDGIAKEDEEIPLTKIELSENMKKDTVGEYFQKIKDKIISDDFEIVWNDIPLSSSDNCEGPYTCPSKKLEDCSEVEGSYTYCWPKDWLAKDCKNIRILGINYDTSLSMWAPLCPSVKEKVTLEERSNLFSKKLLKCNIGERPIVWVTHSMGGLIVKNLLCKAFESEDPALKRICSNTKGIVFYSTPHNGSKVANLSQAISLVLWPSVEVQELRENSPQLKQMHQKFLEITKEVPMEVITFVETKSTVVTAMKFNFLLVEPKSGNPGIGEYYEIPQDHLGICKPENRHSFLYQKILHLLQNIANEAKLRQTTPRDKT